MAHARKQIRDAIAALVTGLPATGNNVYQARVHPMGKQNLPALLIYALSEESEPHAMGAAAELLRTVTVAVEAIVAQAEGVEDTLDGIAVEVEAKIGADPRLAGLALDVALTATAIAFDGEAEMPAGHMRLDYQVQYTTAENDAETTT